MSNWRPNLHYSVNLSLCYIWNESENKRLVAEREMESRGSWQERGKVAGVLFSCMWACVWKRVREPERECFVGRGQQIWGSSELQWSRTHAEIQSQKWRGFGLNIHTAAKPPTHTQSVISRCKPALLYFFHRLQNHVHSNTAHTLNIRNDCVLWDVCVSTHLSLLRLNGWGQCRPTNTHATVWGSANAEPISYIDMARALMRESERDRERERERETERIKEKKKSIPYLNTKHKPSQSSRSVQLAT